MDNPLWIKVAPAMGTRERIVKYLSEHELLSGIQLARLVGLSRQAVSRHLRDLIAEGRVVKEGVTKGARFRLAGPKDRRGRPPALVRKLPLRGLEEDIVFRQSAALLGLHRKLSKQAFASVHYAFTEILNNAIDHSESDQCQVRFLVDRGVVSFGVRDFGIGVFDSIRSKFGLPDEHAAVAELLKGKATTMAEKHSGEGIFFTSKVAERFVLRSHRTIVTFETKKRDVVVEQARFLQGTEASFLLSARSRRSLHTLFEQYAPEEFDYQFERTHVLVKLFRTECVSRSAAKRLVSRLESFKEVVLDFADVTSLGQAFADEVFRGFLRAHPGVFFRVVHLSESLQPMLAHVMDARIAERVVVEGPGQDRAAPTGRG